LLWILIKDEEEDPRPILIFASSFSEVLLEELTDFLTMTPRIYKGDSFFSSSSDEESPFSTVNASAGGIEGAAFLFPKFVPS
jgi:hypothetical protein